MARLPRIVVPGEPHHVTQRGNRRQITFFEDADYLSYMKILVQTCDRFEVELIAFCLMPNHVHLILVPSEERTLSLAVGSTHQKYTSEINYRRGWQGHLWQGRFFSAPMDPDYLNHCVTYVEMNPVKAGLCNTPEEYPWSSSNPTLRHLISSHDSYERVVVSKQVCQSIEEAVKTGRPYGGHDYLVNLEQKTGQKIIKRRPGPKPSA